MTSMRNMIAGAALALLMGQASAYFVGGFSGVDSNGDAFTPLSASPNASTAEKNFKAGLLASSLVSAVGSENFENQPVGASGSLSLALGGIGNVTIGATTGSVAQVVVGNTNGSGRYSAPGGTKFWDTQVGALGSFNIVFDRDIAGFGFYGIDVGDLSGFLSLVMYDANDDEISRLLVPKASSIAAADASVLYFGLIASSSQEFFRRVSFVMSPNLVDSIGFDGFTVGSARTGTVTVPEPATLFLVAAAILGMVLIRKGQRN